MSEWDDLQARVADALKCSCLADFSEKATPLLADLLTYATTVNQERDEAQGACLEWDALHRKERQRADHAEQERDAATARAEQAEDLLREWLEADFYSVRAKDLRTRTKSAFPDETMEQQGARAARRKP